MSDAENSSEDDIYEVEKITNHVVCDGETYYCVTWKGYEGPEAQTWEPKENLLSCEDLLNAYIEEAGIEKTGIAEVKDEIKSLEDSFSDVSSSSEKAQEVVGSDGSSANEKPKQPEKKNIKKDIGKSPNKRRRGRGRASTRSQDKAATPTRRKGRNRGRPPKNQTAAAPGRRHSPSSSSSGDTSSDESPHIKDPFWSNLEKGKVKVFGEDLYSKVKRRRDGCADEVATLPAITSVKKRATKKKASEEKEDKESVKEERKSDNEKEKKQVEEKVASDIEENHSDHSTSPLSSPVLKYLNDQLDEKKKSRRGRKKKNPNAVVEKPVKNVPESNTVPEVQEEKPVEPIVEDVEPPVVQTETKEPVVEESAKSEETNIETDKETLPAPSPSSQSPDVEKSTEKKLASTNEPTKDTFSNTLQKLDKNVTQVAKKEKKKTKKSSEKLLTPEKPSAAKNNKSNDVSDKNEAKDKPLVKRSGSLEKVSKPKDDSLLSPSSAEKSSQSTERRPRLRPSTTSAKTSLTFQKTPSKLQSNATAENPSTNRADENFSVFEAMQKEFEAASYPSSNVPYSPKEDVKERISSEVVNENVDMSEYLKVKVNFSLDEVSLKEVEHHHEAGEPPCRLSREISNAEFRQFIRSNNYEMVFEVLKSKGRMYNLEHQDAMWMTQLMIASAAGYSEIVKVLCYHGARVNARTKSNQTALMYAADKGHAITLRILLMYGAYVNMQTSSGETALMKAVKGGHVSIAHCLLQAGADPSIKSPHGVSALNMEGRTAANAVQLVKKFKHNLEITVDTFVKRTIQQLGLKTIGSSLFGVKAYNVREHALLYFTYHCNIKELPPNQGLVLFAVHGTIGAGLSIKCRLRGPCHVNAVTVNNVVMDPIMPSKENDSYSNFMCNVVWRNGQNSFRFFLAQDGLSREKLYICAYVLSFT